MVSSILTMDECASRAQFKYIRSRKDLNAAHKYFRMQCITKDLGALWLERPEDCVAPAAGGCTAAAAAGCTAPAASKLPGLDIVEIAHASIGPEFGFWKPWSTWKFDWLELVRVFQRDLIEAMFDRGDRKLLGCIYTAAYGSYDHNVACHRMKDLLELRMPEGVQAERKCKQKEGYDIPPPEVAESERYCFVLFFDKGPCLQIKPEWSKNKALVTIVTPEVCTAHAATPTKGRGKSGGPGTYKKFKNDRRYTLSYDVDIPLCNWEHNHGPLWGPTEPWLYTLQAPHRTNQEFNHSVERKYLELTNQNLAMSDHVFREAIEAHNKAVEAHKAAMKACGCEGCCTALAANDQESCADTGLAANEQDLSAANEQDSSADSGLATNDSAGTALAAQGTPTATPKARPPMHASQRSTATSSSIAPPTPTQLSGEVPPPPQRKLPPVRAASSAHSLVRRC